MVTGCATYVPDLDPPQISLLSFRSLPANGHAPGFEITVRVINPNKQSLKIAGIAYSVFVLGTELVKGVANDIPPIDAYSEGVVKIQAYLQPFELMRLLANLGESGADKLVYKFSAKIDFHGFTPTQRIEETGRIALD